MGALISDSARHIAAQAKIDAARLTTKSGNEKKGAITSLARFSQALGNQRRMAAAGDQINAVTENVARNLDASASGKFQTRIQFAEELGASVADAAAAGVGGSSIEQYNRTMALSQAIGEEQGDREVLTQNIAGAAGRGAALKDAVAGMSNDPIFADLDYTEYVDDKKQSMFSKVATLALAAGATYVAGPQAGKAVMKAANATQQANRGDFEGASRSSMEAIGSAYEGVQAYHAGGDDKHFGSAWGKRAFSKGMSSVKTK
jgi:hypothetical protein